MQAIVLIQRWLSAFALVRRYLNATLKSQKELQQRHPVTEPGTCPFTGPSIRVRQQVPVFFFLPPVNSDCSSFAALHWNMGEITIPRRLFLWCMSLIYMCAFVSLYVQIPGNNVHVYVVRAQSHTESCVGKNVSLLTTLASIFNLCVRSPSYATQLSGSFSSSRLTVIVKGSSN